MNNNENKKSSESQNAKILNWLEKGNKITQLDALKLFGCFRLSSRIFDLRERGFEIDTKRVKTNTGKWICEYSLKI